MSRSWRRNPRRRAKLFGAVAVTIILTASAGTQAHAAPPLQPTLAVGAGICLVAGTVSEQFSPAVGALPATVAVNINGSGTCVGNSVITTISMNLTGTALLSCAGGLGTVGGSVSFSNGFPPFSSVTAQYIGGPASEQLDILGTGLTAVADLAWSPTSAATCALSGTVSTPLYGSLVYVYE